MLSLILGLLIGFIAIAMAKDVEVKPRAFALGLAALPLFYMLFALMVGDVGAMALEFAYGLPFFVLGVLCFKRGFKGSGFVVIALWVLHAAYDVYHHLLVANAGVPFWYPALCLGFDMMMVIYLLRLVTRQRDFDITDDRIKV
ncbi:MAG: hypothetical protein ACON4V_03060 [Parvibaculales bacterium]